MFNVTVIFRAYLIEFIGSKYLTFSSTFGVFFLYLFLIFTNYFKYVLFLKDVISY